MIEVNPNRSDIELQVLGALFQFPDEIKASGVYPEIFYHHHHRDALEIIKRRGQDRTALAGVLSYAEQQEIENVFSSANLPAQIADLESLKFARDALGAVRSCAEAFDIMSPGDFRESVSTMLQGIAKSMSANGRMDVKSTNDAQAIFSEYLKNCASISCGIDPRLTLRPGQSLLIGARPGTGKTALLAQVMAHIAANEPGDPIIYSLEMEAGEIFHRLACHAAGRYLRPESDDAMYWAGQLPTFLGGKEIMVCDEPSQTMSKIEAHAAAMCGTRKVSAIGIDYASLIENSGKEKRHELMADVSRRIKLLARNLRVPVICLVQLTKDTTERPTLSSLAESDGFARDANQVWVLWLDNKEQSTLNPTPTNLEILKNRGGFTGIIETMFYKESMAFRKE